MLEGVEQLRDVVMKLERRLGDMHHEGGQVAELYDLAAIVARINSLSIEARRWLFARLRSSWPAYWRPEPSTGGEGS